MNFDNCAKLPGTFHLAISNLLLRASNKNQTAPGEVPCPTGKKREGPILDVFNPNFTVSVTPLIRMRRQPGDGNFLC
jgi:hypothetical protein